MARQKTSVYAFEKELDICYQLLHGYDCDSAHCCVEHVEDFGESAASNAELQGLQLWTLL